MLGTIASMQICRFMHSKEGEKCLISLLYRVLECKSLVMMLYLYLDSPEHGEVRLYYSYLRPSYYRGRVEVFLSETWGRVTGLWIPANAVVVCHQLGYDIPSKCFST